jgi:hypothetical protein
MKTFLRLHSVPPYNPRQRPGTHRVHAPDRHSGVTIGTCALRGGARLLMGVVRRRVKVIL